MSSNSPPHRDQGRDPRFAGRGRKPLRGSSEEQRANHWYATVCTAMDKDNTQGNDSTITMQETIDALRGDSGA